MRTKSRSLLAWISILSIGLIAGILWRLELEWRWGWCSMEWINGFHWALPLGIGLYLLWVFYFCGIASLRKRLGLTVALAATGLVLYSFFMRALLLHFTAGPQALLSLMVPMAVRCGFVAAYPMVPVSVCLVAKVFGVRISLIQWITSVALFLWAWPTAMFLLWLVNHRGSPDVVHAIKSGFVIPFLMVSLALPFLKFPGRVDAH
jgi:hypothetical protein